MNKKGFTPLETVPSRILSRGTGLNSDGASGGLTYNLRKRSIFKRRGERFLSLTGPVRKKISNGAGFTLIEIMLVVIILGILAAMVVPRLTGRSDEARRSVAKTDIESNLALALDLYEVDVGKFPEALDDLMKQPAEATNWKGPYLKKKPLDPWGHPYIYKYPGDHNEEGYDLSCMGKDGVEGGGDDITNWNEE